MINYENGRIVHILLCTYLDNSVCRHIVVLHIQEYKHTWIVCKDCPGRSQRLLVINVPSDQSGLFVFMVMERDVKTRSCRKHFCCGFDVLWKKNKWVSWVETKPCSFTVQSKGSDPLLPFELFFFISLFKYITFAWLWFFFIISSDLRNTNNKKMTNLCKL